jgi:hypothetical protein
MSLERSAGGKVGEKDRGGRNIRSEFFFGRRSKDRLISSHSAARSSEVRGERLTSKSVQIELKKGAKGQVEDKSSFCPDTL